MMVPDIALVGLLLSGVSGGLVVDSGDPLPRADGDIAYMSLWRVLDPADDLCVRVVVPIELDHATWVTKLAFHSFNPKDPATKIVDIYRGTDETTVGIRVHHLVFENHEGAREGWNEFPLDTPILLPPGKYGIAYHGRFEFHSYWAVNTPNGMGYAWARGNDDLPWFLGRADDFGVVPNFGVRVYGVQPKILRATRVRPNGSDQPADPAGPVTPPGPVDEPIARVPRGGDGPDTSDDHEYEPGTAEETFRVIWRPPAGAWPATPARR